MRLIGFTGKAGSGKDTAADYLCQQRGFFKYSFAKPLKDMLAVIGVTDNRETKELPHPVFGVSPRRMMQTLGTDWGRDMICADIWLRCATQALRNTPMIELNKYTLNGSQCSDWGAAKGMAIADVRFENEAAWLRQSGGVLIHIGRPGLVEVAAHVSENGVEFLESDRLLVNDSTVRVLHAKLESILLDCRDPASGLSQSSLPVAG